MNVLADTWRELVRRRLWPVAILLLAALLAVPFLLAKDPVPPVSEVPAAKPVKDDLAATGDPVVALATAEEARRRRVLGTSKDPFEPAPQPKPKATSTPTAEPVELDSGDSVGGGGGGGATGGTGGSTPTPSLTPVVPVSPTPDVKKPTYPLYSIKVRFGSSESDSLPSSRVTRLEALPNAAEPVLVYLGVSKDGKRAVFLVDSGIVAQGDGECKPTASACETIELREGETEFFDVVDPESGEVSDQYQLDLVDIKTKKTASAKQARRQFAKVSRSARKAARARVAARAGAAMAGGFDITH